MSIIYYSATFLIIGLTAQQLFYIREKYSQQNIKLVEYYLHIKLISNIVSKLNSNFYEIERDNIISIIKKYYYLDEIIVYRVQDKKFDLQNYEFKNIETIKNNIQFLIEFLSTSTHQKLYKFNIIETIFGIYFASKNIMIFFIKKENETFNKTELQLLESIILPLFIIKEK
jgi:hypothetical protein